METVVSASSSVALDHATGKAYELVHIVGLNNTISYAIDVVHSALQANVDNLISLAGFELDSSWSHQSLAEAPSIARGNIHMLGKQAKWAMIPIAPV